MYNLSAGIKPIYKVSETKHTGTCMVLVTDKERCVCTHLGASVDIDEDFLQQHWAEVEECTAVYCTAFLLSSSSQVSSKLNIYIICKYAYIYIYIYMYYL